MTEGKTSPSHDWADPVVIGPEAYTSVAYAGEERDKLWRKVWQIACREEELKNPGDYVVYDILKDSIVITRNPDGELSAFYNVCAHRGKRLVNGRGNATQFRCSYHAWCYNLKGENTFVFDKEDWHGAIPQSRFDLLTVKLGCWGGWVWINMDPECEPLLDYLAPAAAMLGAFELDKMRYRWRRRCIYPANWKTALEAFLEAYHIAGTHPQLTKFATYHAWSKAQGLHGNSGYGASRGALASNELGAAMSNTLMRPGKGDDARKSIADLQNEIWRTTDATTTQVFVDAARRLVDELAAGTPPDAVMQHWMASAKADDAARGVIWPTIAPAHMAEAGSSWNIFPNINMLQSVNNCLYYRSRPLDFDPNQCIFEVIALERFPEGGEPQTEWEDADPQSDSGKWPLVLIQDFDNIADVQSGMNSNGFRGAIPNPEQEQKIINFHRNLANYMGRGAPSSGCIAD